MKRFLCLLAAILFILTGCREEDQLVVDPSVTESLVWETMPTLTYGRLEYEKLKVEPWYCGRTEATSSNHMAETEQGYYYMNSSGACSGCITATRKPRVTGFGCAAIHPAPIAHWVFVPP